MSTAPPHGRAHNLPAPLSPLVGRDGEAAAVATLLRRAAVRLVTLTGPGGVGKTRLALRVAAEVADAFPGGVAFVGLAPIIDAELVLPTVAQVLGVREAGDAPLAARLTTFLRGKRLLLVLDNFEQILDAAPLVTDLLAACPELAALVTSRERLRLSGEREYPVPPLGLPVASEAVPAEILADSEAVRLFVERAQAVKPDFTLTEQDAPAVAAIVRRLDGLPLAIELAAARVKVLPPAALLARLERRLPLLTGGGRDLPARQRTMRDAIAWSYDLLVSEERALLQRLAVFVNGFALVAAEAVVGSDLGGVLDGVTSLADKSLLRPEAGTEGEPRYRMLETVREFGLEQLVVSGGEEAARRAHAAWCVDLAERSWDRLVGATDLAWLDRVEADHDNLRAALAWLERTGDAEGMLRLTGSLYWYWHLRSHRREARRCLEHALDAARGAAVDPVARVRALHGAGMLAQLAGDNARAKGYATECLDLARAHGVRWFVAAALELLGFAALWEGSYPEATERGHEALALIDASRDGWFVPLMLADLLGMAAFGHGDLAQAAAHFEDGLAVSRAPMNPYGVALMLGYLGLVACEQGDRASASAQFAASLPLWRELGNWENLAQWLAGVATLATACGRPEKAARLFGAAEALRESLGHTLAPPVRSAVARAARDAGAVLGADAFAVATSAGRAVPLAQAVDEASTFLASVAESAPHVATPGTTTDAGLTPREREVLRLLARRLSNPEIADALFVSPRTVQTHVEHIFAKLGVHSRAEAAAVAVRQGLV